MLYKWKSGSRLKASAQDAGEVCAALEAKGNLTPQALVDASRPNDAPLHAAFEWDDEVAAEKYRESQASYIIRSLEVVIEGTNKRTRGFVSLTITDGEREYHEINRVLSIRSERELLLEEAKRELASFKTKYAVLKELADVFAAIERVSNA